MNVRDAREADAAALAALADAPTDVLRSQLHTRTVRVAVPSTDDRSASSGGDTPSGDESSTDARPGIDDETDILGFVSFDADADTVFVTNVRGSDQACRRLLEEPMSFARAEAMPVEAVVPIGNERQRERLEAVGFEDVGAGPPFEGEPTRRFHLDDTADST